MIRRGLALSFVFTLAAALMVPGLRAQEATSTIAFDGVVNQNGTLLLSGTLTAADDLLGPVTVATDGSGDAAAPGGGVDVGDAAISTDLASKRLVFDLGLNDAVANGGSPSIGYLWAISVNGEDTGQWLGAGGPGTNFAPTTSGGAWLCTLTDAGWSCPMGLQGGPTTDGVTWTLPFFRASPAVEPGSMIDMGGSYGGTPRSFTWPSFFNFAGLAPIDTGGFADSYLVPGEIELGIAPTGTPATAVDYTSTANLNTSSGEFTGALTAPAAGAYTIYAKTCGGLTSSLSCVIGTHDITI